MRSSFFFLCVQLSRSYCVPFTLCVIGNQNAKEWIEILVFVTFLEAIQFFFFWSSFKFIPRCSDVNMHLLKSISQSSKDIRLLWGSVFIRMCSYGITNQVLTLYLKEIGIPESQIGLFMTLTLVGDTLLSYLLTWYSDSIGRRRVMMLGAVLMVVAGSIFASSVTNFYILLIAAIVGVISPSGDETGPFKSIEEACIAHITPVSHRPEIYAVHWTLSAAGSAFGSLACGLMADWYMAHYKATFSETSRMVFSVYTGLAVVKIAIMMMLSEKCEPDVEVAETEPLIQENQGEESSKSLSLKSRALLLKLLVSFMLDSFGFGFMPSAWVVYYFKMIFKVSAAALGTLFFISSICNSFSALPSAYLAKSLGPIRASLVTQFPAALFFMSIPLFRESQLVPASIAFILQQSVSAMDVVPRQVLLTTLFDNRELVKVLGTVNICKTAARCVGPIFTGILAEAGKLGVCYWIGGGLLILSNLILALNFYGMDKAVLAQQNSL